MPTIKEAITSSLVNSGLWPDEAEIITAEYMETQEPMKGRWDEDTTNHPVVLLNILRFGAWNAAIKWLEDNKPKHFALQILRELVQANKSLWDHLLTEEIFEK